MLAPEPATIVLSPTPSEEVASSVPHQLEEVMGKKEEEDYQQEGRKERDDIERFNESFAAYLELGHYLFAHSEVADQRWVKASKALEEARVEVEKAQAKVKSMRVASKIQSTKIEHLREELREEHEKMMNLKTTLAQEEEEKRKAQEGVGAVVERVVKSFKSSRDMEDIRIAFAQEAFNKGIQICLGRVAENFFKVDLDLLMKKLGDRADPSSLRVGVVPTDVPSSSIARAIPEALESITAAPKLAHGSDVNEDTPTSPMVELPKNALDDLGHDSPLSVDANPLLRGVLIKPLIRSLKMEIHRLKKKLRKIKDDLQESRKNALKATIEVTRLRSLHRKDSNNFSTWKDSFEKKMDELRRSASNKSWELTVKISSLEIDLTAIKKKFNYWRKLHHGLPIGPDTIGTGPRDSLNFRSSSMMLKPGIMSIS
ncbi:hypothetical protein COCNU_scaffold002864G000020 [Cocos nucifera]|nr:hypothetical protein [Cocos nucifera]